MTNWKVFTIKDINKYSSYVKIDLDYSVDFDDGRQDYIYCDNTYPFNSWRVGNQIEIDLDRTKYREKVKNIDSTSIVRSSSNALVASSGQALSQTRGAQQIRNEIMDRVDSRGGEYEARIEENQARYFYRK